MNRILVLSLVFVFLPVAAAAAAEPAPLTVVRHQPLPEGAIARLGSHRFVHPERIKRLTFTPDGTAIFAQCTREAVLWDVASGQRLRSFQGGKSAVESAALSLDGRRLALMEYPSKGRVLEVETGKLMSSPGAGAAGNKFQSISISGDGSLVAAGGTGIVLWKADGGLEINRWDFSVAFLCFSRDGKFLACTTGKRKRMWVLPLEAEGNPVQLEGGGGFVEWLEFSPDGDRIAGTCEVEVGVGRHRSSLRIWDRATGKVLREMPGSFNSCSFSPDGRLLAAGNLGGVVVYDAARGKERKRLSGTNGHIHAVVFSQDGKRLASAHGKRARMWKTDTWREIHAGTGHREPVNAVAVSPDGKTIATGSRDRSIILWSWPEAKLRRHVEDVGGHLGVTRLGFSPDGSKVAAAAWINAGDAFFVYDAGSGELISRLGKEHQGHDFLFRPSGKQMVTSGGKGGLHLWDVSSGRHLRSVGGLEKGSIRAIARDPGSDDIWWAGEYQQAGLRDLETGADIQLLEDAHHHSIPDLAVAPGGGWLAIGSRVWDVKSGERISDGHDVPNAISPDGNLLASLHGKGIRIWERHTRQVIQTLGLPGATDNGAGVVNALAFSPDGTVLVSVGDSDSLAWDMSGLLSPRARLLPELKLVGKEMDDLWRVLDSVEGWKAHQAAWKFAAGGAGAVEFLQKRLRPAGKPNAAELESLWARFNETENDFNKRELAARELMDLGVELKPEHLERLRRPDPNAFLSAGSFRAPLAVGEKPKPATKLLPSPVLLSTAKRVREYRALAALERSPSPAARALLERLARGHARSPLTRAASSALKRARGKGSQQ